MSAGGYSRPDDDWLCGRPGDSCLPGPDRRGRCAGRAECRPFRSGDRWFCARSVAGGGACESGPLPDGKCGLPPLSCVPRRSERGKLKVVWRWTLAASVGVLAVVLGGGAIWLSPGPLARGHANLADCAVCHGAGGTLFRAGEPGCFDCHQVGASPFEPHGGADLLEAKSAINRPSAAGRAARAIFSAPTDGVSCAVCHRDHRGAEADLTAVADDRCGFCHQSQFADFAAHPEWDGYRSRRRIAFDHIAHFRRHFPEQDARLRCADCHLPDSGGRRMRLTGFARACAGCHLDEITGRKSGVVRDVVFVNVPALDVEAVRGVGDWPLFAEAEPSAFLKLFLARRLPPETMARVEDLDLADLSAASEADRAAAADFAWAVKRFFADLARRGPAALAMHDQDAADLAAGLPPQVIDAALREWFPRLQDDIARRDSGEPTPTRAVEPDEYPSAADPPTGDDPPAAAADESDDLLAGDESDDLLAGDSLWEEDDLLAADELAPAGRAEAQEPAPDMTAWRRYGGWNLGDYRLEYRPSRHADAFLRGWHTFAAADAPALFAVIGREDAAGKCGKCHTASPAGRLLYDDDYSSADDGRRQIHWRGFRVAADVRHPVSFSHSKHLSIPGAKGCAGCHQIRAEAGDAPDGGGSDFASFQKSDCTQCHNRQSGLSDCALCHNYHYGEVRLRLSDSPAEMPDNPPASDDAIDSGDAAALGDAAASGDAIDSGG